MNHEIKDRKYIKHEKERAKIKFCTGWSFNLEEIPIYSIKPQIDELVYVTEKNTYRISSEDAIAKGFVRVMGGEKKLVIPCKYWSTK